jgi:NodT family efflux transporter outer membrane factor (OMF) lipoprotein
VTHRSSISAAACLFTGFALAGCTVGPDYETPEVPVPAKFSTESGAAPLNLEQWWTTFNDHKLNDLVERAVISNLDLRLARARLREARALRGVVGADLLPDVNVSGSYSRSRTSENAFDFETTGPGGPGFGDFTPPGEERNLYQAGFDANWELDVFGGVRRSIEAANADIGAAVETRRDALVTLLAEVARNYVELRGFQSRLEIARSNLKVQQDTLDLTKARFEGQLVSELDVTRADAQVATTAAQVPALEQQRNQAAHRLSVLMGQPPAALLDELLSGDSATIPEGPDDVPPGLPSDLLRRRPDVRRAERELAAATARVGVATADLFPRFSLTGSLGLMGEEFRDLGDYGSRFYSIGPSVSWPVFDAGRIRSNIRAADARTEQALVRYEQSVLTALEDVENALLSLVKEQERRKSLGRAVEANRRSVEMATQLYDRGLTDFLNVLDAQRARFLSEDALVQSDRTVATDLVALYKALGGGWESSDRR